ncbi:uncharacterized protein BJ212DRAFT_1326446 [Suillus subaureus]|uniref:Uncharacterized protein n=1 Tax=Suillus subaureus TaxID=48587 RepID=A0A9P7AN04_9AGAM|nr:uncharacterized protein BJ212DRAFT_1416825 [Suillus subaureus]XP_041197818.1 uncharacterized protein BJ212DRAFT_1326446 [Suillus subaureus]KAG1792720.1 hypothetical protein BJ212DRAFT_1416825 [Suillus subaureus]KAG1823758.1 hypothetical protein BJ212DRAFT_1326446 [Suillus subaureus]
MINIIAAKSRYYGRIAPTSHCYHKLSTIDTKYHMHKFRNSQLRGKPGPKESLSGLKPRKATT